MDSPRSTLSNGGGMSDFQEHFFSYISGIGDEVSVLQCALSFCKKGNIIFEMVVI